jgi:hypothetical protein
MVRHEAVGVNEYRESPCRRREHPLERDVIGVVLEELRARRGSIADVEHESGGRGPSSSRHGARRGNVDAGGMPETVLIK